MPLHSSELTADMSASEALVSVLMPVYNSSRYLKEAIESLLAQTYGDIEVVLLDDGSSDDSGKIAEWFARSDPRVVVLPRHETNRGVVATRNALLAAARGAYVAWNDSDDVSKPERIACQVGFLRSNPRFGAVGAGIVYADEKLNPIGEETFPADPERQRTDPFICCATLLARRQAARDAGPFRTVFQPGGEDGDWLLKMADRHDITNLPDLLYVYRQHKNSLTHASDKTALVVRLGVMARAAARVRRQGLTDPIDALAPDKLGEQLSAHALLTNPIFTQTEILTGLSHKIAGERPALSIAFSPAPDPARLPRLLAACNAQSMPSFEILLAATISDAARLQKLVDESKASARVVVCDPALEAPWATLIKAAHGRYFLYGAGRARFRPHRVYEIVRRQIGAAGAAAIVSSDSIWSLLTPRVLPRIDKRSLLSGEVMGLMIKPDAALAVLAAGDAGPPLQPIRVEGEFLNFPGLLYKAKRVFVASRRILQVEGPRAFAVAAASRVLGINLGDRPLRRAAVDARAAAATISIDFKTAAAQATVKVAVHESWGDFEESLQYMTPGASALWGGVLFAPAARVENPDFVLVLNTPPHEVLKVCMPPNRVWFAIGEPPTDSHRVLHEGQGTGTVVLTCDPAVEQGRRLERRFIHTPVMTRTWHVKRSLEELAALGPLDKPKRLSWVTSNTRALEGHRRRMRFLDALRTHVDFDLFGRGFTPIDDKWDGIAPYRYSIAFENTVAPLYFTEKLMDCFVCRTLPFYFGSPDIARYFPEKAMIRIDPDDPLVFDRIKDISASDLWRERQDALAEASQLVLYKYNMYQRLADLMLQEAARGTTEHVEMTIHRRVAL